MYNTFITTEPFGSITIIIENSNNQNLMII